MIRFEVTNDGSLGKDGGISWISSYYCTPGTSISEENCSECYKLEGFEPNPPIPDVYVGHAECGDDGYAYAFLNIHDGQYLGNSINPGFCDGWPSHANTLTRVESYELKFSCS